jgi:apolipoprotein D and lipocalin family protein
MRDKTIISCAGIPGLLPGVDAGSVATESSTVEQLDPERETGRWYEITSLPNFFQRHCVPNTTAGCRLREGGTITVANLIETAEGEVDAARRPGCPADAAAKAKPEVSFGNVFGKRGFPVFGSIIGPGVDDFALLDIRSRRRDWILARDPGPSPQRIASRCENLAAQGNHTGGRVPVAEGSPSNAEAGR